jgi:hypothetical protein
MLMIQTIASACAEPVLSALTLSGEITPLTEEKAQKWDSRHTLLLSAELESP